MAWTSILATQTDANSPLNQVLMDAIRNDLDDLDARGCQIFRWGSTGEIYRENSAYDGSLDATLYEGGGSTQVICRRAPMTGGGNNLALLSGFRIKVPSWAGRLEVDARVTVAAVSGDPDNSTLTFALGGGDSAESVELLNPTTGAWITTTDLAVTVAGAQTFGVTCANPNAANRSVITLHEVVVRAYRS